MRSLLEYELDSRQMALAKRQACIELFRTSLSKYLRLNKILTRYEFRKIRLVMLNAILYSFKTALLSLDYRMNKISKHFFKIFVALMLLPFGSLCAQDVRTDHPQEYVVEKGDTLWDIAGFFLEDPWLWPEIWEVNEQVENPHLIFPGDILRLIYVDGQPRIVRDHGVVKLSPQIRVQTHNEYSLGRDKRIFHQKSRGDEG